MQAPLTRTDINTASANAEAPSYIDALATSIPVSSHTIVWNSKMARRVPWLTSGW